MNENGAIDIFAIAEGTAESMAILTALAGMANQMSPLRFNDKRTACVLVASRRKLELFSIQLYLSRVV